MNGIFDKKALSYDQKCKFQKYIQTNFSALGMT